MSKAYANRETSLFPEMLPASYFAFTAECLHCPPENFTGLEEAYLLPDTAAYCGEEGVVDVHAAWHEQGMSFSFEASPALQQAVYPQYQKGDAVELWIDTRDVKSAKVITRFCHHFVFLPQIVEGIQAQELTRFRAEEQHDLCSHEDLHVEQKKQGRRSLLKIFIPSHCLFGYDPAQITNLGFTYRVFSRGRVVQHFGVSSKEYPIEQQPSLWPSLQLIS